MKASRHAVVALCRGNRRATRWVIDGGMSVRRQGRRARVGSAIDVDFAI
jgi:hypothetical protein